MKKKKRIGPSGLVRFLFGSFAPGRSHAVAEKKYGAERFESLLRRSSFYPRPIA